MDMAVKCMYCLEGLTVEKNLLYHHVHCSTAYIKQEPETYEADSPLESKLEFAGDAICTEVQSPLFQPNTREYEEDRNSSSLSRGDINFIEVPGNMSDSEEGVEELLISVSPKWVVVPHFVGEEPTPSTPKKTPPKQMDVPKGQSLNEAENNRCNLIKELTVSNGAERNNKRGARESGDRGGAAGSDGRRGAEGSRAEKELQRKCLRLEQKVAELEKENEVLDALNKKFQERLFSLIDDKQLIVLAPEPEKPAEVGLFSKAADGRVHIGHSVFITEEAHNRVFVRGNHQSFSLFVRDLAVAVWGEALRTHSVTGERCRSVAGAEKKPPLPDREYRAVRDRFEDFLRSKLNDNDEIKKQLSLMNRHISNKCQQILQKKSGKTYKRVKKAKVAVMQTDVGQVEEVPIDEVAYMPE